MGLVDKFFKKNKSNDNIKEITYFSTDKNSFVKCKIPNHMNIYIDNSDKYDINSYYKDKHISNDSYFLYYPNTISNYKQKLQETGVLLEQSFINDTYIETDTDDFIIDRDSDDIIDEYVDNIDSDDNKDEYVDNKDDNKDQYVDNIDSDDNINDYIDIIDEYIDNPVLNDKIIEIEQSKTFYLNKFYNELNETEKKYYTPSIYSNLDLQ
jgi:hypothetical protein